MPAYRAAAAQRRAEAFCQAPEYIAGIRVLPPSPASWSMLYAIGSRFVRGGSPGEGDVRNYLWFHSPLYCAPSAPFFRLRKWLALEPLLRRLAPPFHRPADRRYFAVLLVAIEQIRRHLSEAFADAPPASGRGGASLATLEAYFIHEFAMAYQWKPDRTRWTPLRQLTQLHRCIRAARGEKIIDAGEEDLLYRHLLTRNAALSAHRPPAPGSN